jgi:Domain of unknown function (DUF6046)
MPLNLNIKFDQSTQLTRDAIISGFGLRGIVPFPYQAGSQSKYVSGGVEREPGIPSKYPIGPPERPINEHMNGEGSDVNRTSWFGLPVFADVRFKDDDGDEDVRLDTVLIEVTQTRNIVSTAVQGRDGTVKEYISDGDYSISMKGALVARDADVYPAVGIRALHTQLVKKRQIDIVSDYLRLFGIYSIVVTDYKFPQQEGFHNVQLFEINAVSDVPEELVLEE